MRTEIEVGDYVVSLVDSNSLSRGDIVKVVALSKEVFKTGHSRWVEKSTVARILSSEEASKLPKGTRLIRIVPPGHNIPYRQKYHLETLVHAGPNWARTDFSYALAPEEPEPDKNELNLRLEHVLDILEDVQVEIANLVQK